MALVRRSPHMCAGCALLILTSSCAGWQRPDPAVPSVYDERQQVQVWQGNSAVVWHGVRVRGDTLTGIAYQRPLRCDSCTAALPLAQVDSVRFGNLEMGVLLLALPIAAIGAVADMLRRGFSR